MAEDTTKSVQAGTKNAQGQALKEEPVPTPTGEVEKGTVQPPAPLTPEALQEMIDKAVAKATEQAKEMGRRELQRQQDRNKAALERESRRAGSAEGLIKSIRTRYQDENPELAKDLELEELRARDAARRSHEEEETIRQQQESFAQALQTSLVEHLKSLDIDPQDKRVDWAEDAKDYVTGRSRFDTSVAKIIKENQETMKKGFEDRLKALEDKINKSQEEANSVDTTIPKGAVAGPDAEFLRDFGSGKLPMSKENIARYEKIVKTQG